MRLDLTRRIVAVFAVAVFTAAGLLAAATSTHAHEAGHALQHHLHVHDHATAGSHAAHEHDHSERGPSDAPGSCDHPQHACCHTHGSCCSSALGVMAFQPPLPIHAGLKLTRTYEVLPSGRMTHPLLRPPRAAA